MMQWAEKKLDNVWDSLKCDRVRCCITGQMEDDEEHYDAPHHKLQADSSSAVSFYNAYNRTLQRVRHKCVWY